MMPDLCNRRLRDEWHKYRDSVLAFASTRKAKCNDLMQILEAMDDLDEGMVLFHLT
jgi:hypothetical protein